MDQQDRIQKPFYQGCFSGGHHNPPKHKYAQNVHRSLWNQEKNTSQSYDFSEEVKKVYMIHTMLRGEGGALIGAT